MAVSLLSKPLRNKVFRDPEGFPTHDESGTWKRGQRLSWRLLLLGGHHARVVQNPDDGGPCSRRFHDRSADSGRSSALLGTSLQIRLGLPPLCLCSPRLLWAALL